MDTGETNTVVKHLSSSFLPAANIPHNSLEIIMIIDDILRTYPTSFFWDLNMNISSSPVTMR